MMYPLGLFSASSPIVSGRRHDLQGLSPEQRGLLHHGVEAALADGRRLVCSFHPSQQNTFTRKLTVPMFDGIFSRVRELERL